MIRLEDWCRGWGISRTRQRPGIWGTGLSMGATLVGLLAVEDMDPEVAISCSQAVLPVEDKDSNPPTKPLTQK